MNLYSHMLFGGQFFGNDEYKTVTFEAPIKAFEGLEVTCTLRKNNKYLSVEVKKPEDKYVSFTLSSINNNCGLILLSEIDYSEWDDDWDEWDNAETDENFVFDGAIEMCKRMEYSQILYTVCDRQSDLIEALKKKGFKLLKDSKVRNQRSGNDISMYVLNIN